MNKKIISILILIALMLPVLVSANARTSDSFLGGIETNILDTVVKILNYEVKINMFSFANGTQTGYAKAIPLWAVFASFAIIYSLLWIATSKIAIFQENRTPRIMFVLGITLIAMFTTPVAAWILALIGSFTTIAVILIVVLAGFVVWTMFRSGWANSAVVNQEANRSLADASRVSAEVARQSAQTQEYANKTAHAIKNGLDAQVKAIQQTRGDLQAVVTDVTTARKRGLPPAAATMTRIAKNMNKISQDIGAISSFKTNNDRLMAGMSNRQFSEKRNVSSIGSLSAGAAATATAPAMPKGLVEIRNRADTETNDLGRAVTEISGLILKGLSNERVAARVIELGNISINIMQRMEKDIALEEQLIEKM